MDRLNAVILLSVSLFVFSCSAYAQWESIGPEGAGPVRIAVQDPYLIGMGDRIYRKPLRGGPWVALPQDTLLRTFTHTCLLTTDGVLMMGGYKGIFTSTDQGSSWSAATQLSPVYVTALAAAQGVWFAGTGNGFYRSTDKGTTWERLPYTTSLELSRSMTSITTGSPGAMMSSLFSAGSVNGVLRSTDLGLTWHHADAEISSVGVTALGSHTYAMLIAGEVQTFGSVYAGVGLNGAWVTNNHGSSWSKVAPGLEGHWINAFVVAGGLTGDTLLAGTREGVFMHAAGDSMWRQVLHGIPACNVESLVRNESTIYAGTHSGIFVSNDCGVTWTRLGQGLPTMAFDRLAANASHLFAGSWDMERRSHATGTWEILPFSASRLDHIVDIDAGWGSFVNFVVWNDSGYWSSTDNGATWTHRRIPEHGAWFSIAHDEARSRLYAGVGAGVLVSLDGGVTWARTGVGTFPSNTAALNIQTVSSGLLPTVVCVTGRAVCYSEDDGESWVARAVPPDGHPAYQYIGGLAVSGTHWYVINEGNDTAQLLRSGNRGVSWDTLHPPTARVRLVRWSDPWLIAAGSDTIGISTDNGTTWARTATPGPGHYGLTDLTVFHDSMYVAAPPGLMKRSISSILAPATVASSDIPEGFRLFQCYPNPFNPNSDIRYQIAEFGTVNLAVFDVLGREVAVLVSEKKAPGTYQVRFDGAGLTSGVYFYRLHAGNHVETRKMMLVR